MKTEIYKNLSLENLPNEEGIKKKKRPKKPNGYWNYENCYNEALKYSTTCDFRRKSQTAYKTAKESEWIKDYNWLENSLNTSNSKRIKWDYQSCYDLAKTCTSKSDMKGKNDRAYMVALKNKWFSDYTWFYTTDELRRKTRPSRVKWTYEKAFVIASKYNKMSDFRKDNPSLYTICNRKKWINDFDWLGRSGIDVLSSDNVYAYLFKELNSVYVGRTIHPQERHKSHCTSDKSSVYIFALKNQIKIPEMTILESNMPVEKGLEKEEEYIERFKKEGWIIINKAKVGVKSGSVGYMVKKWNKKSCRQEALKHKKLKDFRKQSATAYNTAVKNKWIDSYKWLKTDVHKNGYWSYEKCYEEAKKYTRRIDFQKGCGSAYDKALKEKWINDYNWFCPSVSVKKYNYEYTYNLAKKYCKLSDFRKEYGRAYSVAKKNNWIPDYTWMEIKDISKKQVEQYDLEGNFIATFNGAREASRILGITSSSIIQCCNGKFKQTKGYIFKYKR